MWVLFKKEIVCEWYSCRIRRADCECEGVEWDLVKKWVDWADGNDKHWSVTDTLLEQSTLLRSFEL